MKSLTLQEIQVHHTTQSLWFIYKGKVYDMSNFLFDHPGGEEILLSHGGTDITEILQDDKIHFHSDAALSMLEEYCIGTLASNGSQESLETLFEEERGEKVKIHDINDNFIDITKPMLRQIFNLNCTTEEYIKQVHLPRYTTDSAPIFGGALEVLTKTYWWVIPLFWGPIVIVFYNFARIYLSSQVALAVWICGLFGFSLIEYCLHRFLFHIDDNLPDYRYARTIHFLIHGVHHFLPMDRLVLPPALGVILAIPLWGFTRMVAPNGVAEAFYSGAILGLIFYDMVHYYSHHGKPWGSYLKAVKSYHLDHHYKNSHLGFGVSSRFWDIVFHTELI